MKVIFLPVSSLGCCTCTWAVLIALIGYIVILTLVTMKDKSYYPHFTYQEMEPTAVENFVQGHVVCKCHAGT